MKAKVLKAQFNELCLGGMILDMQSVTLHSGPNKMNGIELSQQGINIQTEIGQPIVLNSPIINGPGYSFLSTPADFFPWAHVFLPKKTIAPIIGIADQFKGLAIVSSLIATAGALR